MSSRIVPHTAGLLKSLFLVLFGFNAGTIFAAEEPNTQVPAANVEQHLETSRGLAVFVGNPAALPEPVISNSRLLFHFLLPEQIAAEALRTRLQEDGRSAQVEHWTGRGLPHAENIANVIVVETADRIDRPEIERVLCPGGIAFFRTGDGYKSWTKPALEGADEWSHQWHNAAGGLVTRDANIGVPQGIQWLSGPLFAMAGRKSSTQSLVSAGGINFYVTQNVAANLALDETMPQYLVAKDAYNGLTLWEREWTGPFVTGDGETNPRMVATNDNLYVAGDNQLIAVDAKTGETTGERQLSEDVEKILVSSERLLIQSDSLIQAFDLKLQNLVWTIDDLKPLELVADEQFAYFLVRGRSADGQFQHDLLCVDIASGQRKWKQNTQPHVIAASVRINFVEDGLVALQAHGHLHVFSSEDGTHQWSRTTEARPGKDYVDERYVGHFYCNNLVWMLEQNSPRQPTGQNCWVGLDPKTGDVIRELITVGEWPKSETPAKMGCQLLIASDRYIMIPRQATFIDFETGEKQSFKFTRGGCGQGFIPANGLLYSHPHACGCFSEAVRGFMAMHSQDLRSVVDARNISADRLILGDSFELSNEKNSPSEWPMHRGNAQRTAASSVALGTEINNRWSQSLAKPIDSESNDAWHLRSGQVLTAPTVSGDQVYVADVNLGKLFALDSANGETLWTFSAHGRIDSPPTLHRGLCLFGSHDGYVYALRADNGSLVWKFRAAPSERRIMAYGSLESAWPVAGSVLVLDGVAMVAAGRAPDADGGIFVHGLNPSTGQSIWSVNVQDERFHGMSDYLVTDAKGEFAYLSNWQFNPTNGQNGPAEENSSHLRGGKVGLLEPAWTQHDLATRKDIQTWEANGLSGQLLAFSPDVQASYDFDKGQIQLADQGVVQINAPQQVTSLTFAKNFVVIAGGQDRHQPNEGGFLQVWDTASSKMVMSAELSSQPVLDGVAIANGNILVSMQNGQIHCFTASKK